MRKSRRTIITAILLTSAVFLLGTGCQQSNGLTRLFGGGARIKIVTTIFPLADIAREIVGENTTVITAVPLTVNPDTFTVNSGNLEDLRDADMLVITGVGLDNVEVPLLGNISRRTTVVNAAEAVVTRGDDDIDSSGVNVTDSGADENTSFIRELFSRIFRNRAPNGQQNDTSDVPDGIDTSAVDQYFWLAPANMRAVVRGIRDGLIAADPRNRQEYLQRSSLLLTQLEQLERTYERGLQGCKKDTVYINKDVLSTLGATYGFSVQTFDPSNLTRVVPRGGRNILLYSTGSDKDDYAPLVRNDTALLPFSTIAFIDDQDENYFQLMGRNLTVLQLALSCTLSL